MNVLSQNNTLLSINGGGANGDMWTSGLEFSGSVITGYSGSAFGGDGCHCDSAAIASAGSAAATAWADEQGYITALPEMNFVETTALNFTDNGMISGISGNPLYAQKADSASSADSAAYAESTQYATSALSASYSESAGIADSANWASSATNALNSEYANISNCAVTALYAENDINGNSITATYLTTGSFSGLPYVQNSALEFTNDGKVSAISGSGFFAEGADSASSASTAIYVASGWETNTAGQITGYSGTAIAGGGGGGGAEYTGIAPIVVNNAEYKISADTAMLGVEYPLYFAEDSETATVIAIHDSAISGKDWTNEINSASAYAYSAATADSLASANYWNSTYNTVYNNSASWTGGIEYTAGANINITSHVISGKDWTNTITGASSYAYNQATALIPNTGNLPYVQNSSLHIDDGTVTGISSYNVGHPQIPVSGESGIYLTHKNDAVYIGFNSAQAIIDMFNLLTAYSGRWVLQ